MKQYEHFLALDDLLQRGAALNAKLMPAGMKLRQVTLHDAQSWQTRYTTRVAECLLLLDADLQRLFMAVHLGSDDRLGAQRVLNCWSKRVILIWPWPNRPPRSSAHSSGAAHSATCWAGT